MDFRLLRYIPDPVKGEFVNIAVIVAAQNGRCEAARVAADEDLRRVRCLHPAADLDLLRSCLNMVREQVEKDARQASDWLRSLDETASNSLAWSTAAAYDDVDPHLAAQTLYDAFVASRPRAVRTNSRRTGLWVKREADSVLDAEHLRPRFDQNIGAHRFTFPGDPFRIHYGYRNGAPRYIHMLSLQYSVQQARALAFTFERMRHTGAHMTAVVEPDAPAIPTVEFARELLQQNGIEVLPLDGIQGLVRRVKHDLHIQ